MFFSPFSVTHYEFGSGSDKRQIVYGSFLRFDDVNELVDTNCGLTEYRSKGNTSSKRYNLEFYFDPACHILAIQDAKGLPARNPLIEALRKILEIHSKKIFQKHHIEIDELTSADSINEFLKKPKKGYKKYDGIIKFSNSDSFDEEMENALKKTEGELKDKRVGKWEASYKSFPDSVMTDLPEQAIIQMGRATRYGNAEVSYL